MLLKRGDGLEYGHRSARENRGEAACFTAWYQAKRGEKNVRLSFRKGKGYVKKC